MGSEWHEPHCDRQTHYQSGSRYESLPARGMIISLQSRVALIYGYQNMEHINIISFLICQMSLKHVESFFLLEFFYTLYLRPSSPSFPSIVTHGSLTRTTHACVSGMPVHVPLLYSYASSSEASLGRCSAS